MILVTGATGFIGSFICRQLLIDKKPFLALKREQSSLELLQDVKNQINWHDGDITSIDTIETIIDKIDIIIHSAAIVSFHKADRSLMDEVNVNGTKNLVNLCLKYNIKQFIHISSVAAIGRNQQSATINENNKWQQSKLNSYYGESKYLAELEVWRGHIEGLNTVILNPSVVLGPGNWDRSSTTLFKYIWKEKQYYTNGILNYVDIRDIVAITSKLIDDTTLYGERYILNAGAISYKNMFEKIATRFNKKAPSINATLSHIKLALFYSWMRYLLTGSKPMVTKEMAINSNNQIYFDNTKVVNKLNHNFVSLNETLDWTCSQFLNNKK